MIIYNSIQIGLKRCFTSFFLLILVFGTTNLYANKCGVLKLQSSRSHGATIVSNDCANTDELSLDAMFQIQGSGRAWLESVSVLQDPGNFLIICQNNSSSPINLKVNNDTLPWFSPENDSQCNKWTNNRLQCNDSATGHASLICAITTVKKSLASKMAGRSTSVIMRGINQKEKTFSADYAQSQLSQWTANLQPEVNLCRTAFESNQPITLSLSIKTTGKIGQPSIQEPGINNQLADCVYEVVNNFKFPMLDEETRITFSF